MRARFTEQGFPPLVARWLDELFPEGAPVETHTTCSACPMVPAQEGVLAEAIRFDPVVRCCTFLPRVPNFLVGGLLLDDDPGMAFGQERMRERIANGVAASPMGVGRSRTYMTLFGDGNGFGTNPSLRCPFHRDDGRCGVWRHREATCSTWFCKHERGAVGAVFWRILRDALSNVEHDLARWCALELGIPPEALEAIGVLPMGHMRVNPQPIEDVDKEVDPEFYRAIWGDWADREVELYLECARMIAPLGWSQVEERCGSRIQLILEDARKALANMLDDRLPTLVHIRLPGILKRDATACRMDSYSAFNTMVAPPWIEELLELVDGRPLSEIMGVLRARGLPADEPLVRKLIDYGVLRDGDSLEP